MCEQCGYEGSCQDAWTELSYYTMVQPRPPFIHQFETKRFTAEYAQPVIRQFCAT